MGFIDIRKQAEEAVTPNVRTTFAFPEPPPQRTILLRRLLTGLVVVLATTLVALYVVLGAQLARSIGISAPRVESGEIHQLASPTLPNRVNEQDPYAESLWDCNGTFTNDPASNRCRRVHVGERKETFGHRYFTPLW